MSFDSAAVNFVILMTAAFVLLFIDLSFWLRRKPTFSETIWGVNQWTLALAFGVGMVCGHCFTVPW
jgi:uncharacterized membrane protein YbhN (UPF0104 family)